MNIAIVLNGQPFQRKIEEGFILCADGGYHHLPKGQKPDLILGDLDSVGEIPGGIPVERFPVEKNCSDGELAVLKAKDLGGERITLYGAKGGRTDHAYVNLRLLPLIHSLGMEGRIAENHTDIYFEDKDFTVKGKKDALISILPYGDAALIGHSEGLYYPLENLRLDSRNPSRGLSNRMLSDTARITIKEGAVFVFVYFDD